MESEVDKLVVFLSNPNRKAEEHVETVMQMVRRLARYEHELNQSKDEIAKMRNEFMNGIDPSYHPYRGRRALDIPENARSVEVKF